MAKSTTTSNSTIAGRVAPRAQGRKCAWWRENCSPDGNSDSAGSGPRQVVPRRQSDGEDLPVLVAASGAAQSEAWWRAHLDLLAYYGFQALNRLLANIDLRPD